ncbi:aldo/keto reductase [Homoserinibacter sp. YIM 151385]|uniref:aldo/keto reductase n=1 Tax=Homoserinibacter sp. YIM 151385 TaxID=2985506 RepID=UPI0022F092CF|nr:aldo/keto reductase [Homoserinibacter sp. YIM 151385]WBU37142.1 aldo/keto reductase [Homoserinibacter sp. YIM 151385]
MGIGIDLEPVTIGTSGLGKRPGADARVARAMLESPLAQLDTSNNYALGETERLLGAALDEAGGLPAGKVVFSKIDQDPETGVFDYDRAMRSFEETRGRLHLDTLPLLHLHDPYTITVAEGLGKGGPVEALLRLKEEGLVGAIGIAAGTRALVEEYVRSGVFDAVLTHNRYTLVERSGLGIIEAAAERGMTVFNAAPFGGGILAGSAFRGQQYAYQPASDDLASWIDRLHALCAAHGLDVAAVALAFSMREPRIHSTVVGVYSLERVEALPGLAAAAAGIPTGFWDELETELGTPPATPAD